MSQLRVSNFSVSVDGFAAGPDQSVEAPMGVGGERLHEWVFATAWGRDFVGGSGGSTGVDHELAAAGDDGIGATIIGRNMFGPVRGPWPDESWRGWWGEEPPYAHEVFVLTHHLRPSLRMGATTFHFVDDSPTGVLERAVRAADGLDVRLGGGPGTVREFLRQGLVDRLHVVVTPVLVGAGERLFGEWPSLPDAYRVSGSVVGDGVLHVHLSRRVT